MDLGTCAFIRVIALSPTSPLPLVATSVLGTVFIVAARLGLSSVIGADIEVIAFCPFFPRSFRAPASLDTRIIETTFLAFGIPIVTEVFAGAFTSASPYAVSAGLNQDSFII